MNTWFFTMKPKFYNEKKASSTNGAGITGCQHVEECKYIHIFPPCTKLKSKQIKALNINSAIPNFIREKLGSNLECIGTGDHFLNMTPLVQTLRAAFNKWDLLKQVSFYKAKKTVNKTKQHPTEWEKNPHQLHITQRTDFQNTHTKKTLETRYQNIK